MRKSGLQKQISSIFNEAPVPVGDLDATELPVEPVAEQMPAPTSVEAPAIEMPVAKPSMPSLTQRMAQAPTAEAVHTPAAPTMRPRPLTRTAETEQKPKANISVQLKKAVSGSGKSMDPRQKKMTIMVGVLMLVFGVVLFISLGGLGQAQAKASGNKETDNDTTVVKDDSTSLQWHSPQPLPEQLRDPMKPAQKKIANNTNDQTSIALVGGLIVKGIVFSKTNPTAIINEKIVAQGETIDGIRIVRIGREEVEFEQNGQRWTQPVQR